MARNKYTYYASRARKDGYEQIAALFQETAHNEKEHAKLWFKVELGRHRHHLRDLSAAEGETSGPTCTSGWPRRPGREGFHRIAVDMFLGVAEIEKSPLQLTSEAPGEPGEQRGLQEELRQGVSTAATAAIWSMATRPPRYVPYAAILSPSLRSRPTTIDPDTTTYKTKKRNGQSVRSSLFIISSDPSRSPPAPVRRRSRRRASGWG